MLRMHTLWPPQMMKMMLMPRPLHPEICELPTASEVMHALAFVGSHPRRNHKLPDGFRSLSMTFAVLQDLHNMELRTASLFATAIACFDASRANCPGITEYWQDDLKCPNCIHLVVGIVPGIIYAGDSASSNSIVRVPCRHPEICSTADRP